MYTIAIVGRPNVGKSTLFNRLIGAPTAIVENEPGITRDRIYGESDWNGVSFRVIDTGGLLLHPKDIFQKEIKKQSAVAQQEADLILLVVDVLSQITSEDEAIVQWLRKQEKPVLIAANKADNELRKLDAAVFYALGFEDVFPISSINGSGTGELLDQLVARLPNQQADASVIPEDIPKIAILGQPNVGKSTLTNALLGENRTLATPISGTTRDAIHTHYKLYGQEVILIDTAGLRRKDRSKENVEFYSAIRTVKTIDLADVCIILFDVSQANIFQAQDLAIFSLASRKGKGVILVGNKWDSVSEKQTNSTTAYLAYIKEKISPFTDVPIVFISATEKQRIHKTLSLAIEVYKRKTSPIATSMLNEWLKKTIEKYPPPHYRGRPVKINYVTQLPTYHCAMAFFCNHPDAIANTYKSYLENQLRLQFDLSGVPVRLYFRKK